MFSQLFFLMLIWVFAGQANLAPSAVPFAATMTPFVQGLTLYFATVFLLCVINRYLIRGTPPSNGKILFLDQIAITFVLGIILLYLKSAQILAFAFAPFVLTSTVVSTFFLYFLAIYATHFAYYMRYYDVATAHRRAYNAMMFALPITFPLILLELIIDLFGDKFSYSYESLFLGCALFLAYILLVMLFLPPMLVRAWRCPLLRDDTLTDRLDVICERTNFHHSGYRLWTIFEDRATAAITGLIAPMRSILFTKKLLAIMPTECVEAVLAHEIGHNKRKHLWLFPFITSWLILATYLVIILVEKMIVIPEDTVNYAEIIMFVIIFGLLFRFGIGLFSRLFERQADLYVYEAGVDPKHLIEAFQRIVKASGGNENDPSWHHYSIRERIDFLRHTMEDPSLIVQHDRRVYITLAIFAVVYIITVALLFLL